MINTSKEAKSKENKSQDDLTQNFESGLKEWIQKEKLATELISVVGKLWYEKSVELVIFRRKLIDIGVNTILNHHLRAREIIKKELTIRDTVELARELEKLDLAPAKIDIGKLGSQWLQEKNSFDSKVSFVNKKLIGFTGQKKNHIKPKDVILFGFGRIGRLAARALIGQTGRGQQLRLRAIVLRKVNDQQIAKRAELLRNDSIHGPFRGTVTEDYQNKSLVVNGQRIHLVAVNGPSEIDYTLFGIQNALMIDSTGAFRNRHGLEGQLKAKGVDKVLLTAPGKDDIPNIVHGVNHKNFNHQEKIFSAASCTTNAIVPVLKVMDDQFGIDYGHIETVHSYTNDQNLIDNYHKKYRRGRGAPLNLVITETGAGKAVGKALPDLQGKLTGNAVRVPTPNGSLAILNLTLKKGSSPGEINKTLKEESLHGDMIEQIEFSENNELVSSDIIGNPHASIVDGAATLMGKNNKNVVLYVWYDNEYGYTEQVVRLAKHLAGVRRLTYY